MHIHAKAVAQHSKRLTDATLAVERITDGERMNEVTFGSQRLFCTSSQNAADICLFDFMAAKIDACGKGFAFETASRNIHDEAIDGQASHALGRIYRKADRLLGRIKVDNDAGFHAARTLMADAQHFHAMGASWQQRAAFMRAQPCDDTGNLARPNVQNR